VKGDERFGASPLSCSLQLHQTVVREGENPSAIRAASFWRVSLFCSSTKYKFSLCCIIHNIGTSSTEQVNSFFSFYFKKNILQLSVLK
jgi:hypothetical protein